MRGGVEIHSTFRKCIFQHATKREKSGQFGVKPLQPCTEDRSLTIQRPSMKLVRDFETAGGLGSARPTICIRSANSIMLLPQGFKDGITVADMVRAVQTGKIIEWYPERPFPRKTNG